VITVNVGITVHVNKSKPKKHKQSAIVKLQERNALVETLVTAKN